MLAIAIAPLFAGWIAQCRAWLQNRSAPPLLQPYRMLRKLFNKDAALATDASAPLPDDALRIVRNDGAWRPPLSLRWVPTCRSRGWPMPSR